MGSTHTKYLNEIIPKSMVVSQMPVNKQLGPVLGMNNKDLGLNNHHTSDHHHLMHHMVMSTTNQEARPPSMVFTPLINLSQIMINVILVTLMSLIIRHILSSNKHRDQAPILSKHLTTGCSSSNSRINKLQQDSELKLKLNNPHSLGPCHLILNTRSMTPRREE